LTVIFARPSSRHSYLGPAFTAVTSDDGRAVLGFNLIWLIGGTSDPVRLGSIMDAMLKVCSFSLLLYYSQA